MLNEVESYIEYHVNWLLRSYTVCESYLHFVSWMTRSQFVQVHNKNTNAPHYWFNSLAPGKFEWNFRHVIFNHLLVMDGKGISCEIALLSMSRNFTDDQSTLVQVMAWCRQSTSHYLSQCRPRSLSPYGVIRPQSVKMWSCACITK